MRTTREDFQIPSFSEFRSEKTTMMNNDSIPVRILSPKTPPPSSFLQQRQHPPPPSFYLPSESEGHPPLYSSIVPAVLPIDHSPPSLLTASTPPDPSLKLQTPSPPSFLCEHVQNCPVCSNAFTCKDQSLVYTFFFLTLFILVLIVLYLLKRSFQ